MSKQAPSGRSLAQRRLDQQNALQRANAPHQPFTPQQMAEALAENEQEARDRASPIPVVFPQGD
jgi:hypothetical protein